MAGALGSLVVKLALEYAEYTRGLDKSSQEGLKFAQNAQRNFDSAARSGKAALSSLAAAAVPAIAAFASVSTVIAQFNKSINELAFLDDFTQKTGVAVETASRLQQVAKQFNQDFALVEASVIKLSRGIAGFDDETSSATKALDRLGISARDAEGNLRDPGDLVIDIARKLQDFSDGADKARIAQDLFGKSGADLLPYLNDVADNVDRFSGVSAEAAARAAQLQDEIGALRVESDNLFQSIAIGLTPGLVELVKTFNQAGIAGLSLEGTMARLKLIAPGIVYPLKWLFGAEAQASTGNAAKGRIINPADEQAAAMRAAADKFRQDNPFKDRAAALEIYNAKLVQLNDLEAKGAITAGEATRYRAQFRAELDRSSKSVSVAKAKTEEYSLAEQAHMERIATWVEYQKQQNQLRAEFTAGLDAARQTVENLVTSTQGEIEALQGEIDLLVLGKDRVRELELARIDEAASAYEQSAAYARLNGVAQENIDYMEAQAQNLRELAAARKELFNKQDEKTRIESAEQARKDAAIKTGRDIEKENDRTADNMQRSITDALLRGFEGGKDIAGNFKDTLINMFKTLVLRPSIEFLTAPVGKLLSGVASSLFGGSPAFASGLDGLVAGGSGGTSITGVLGSLKSGIDALSGNLVGGIEKLGVMLANGQGGILDAVGGFMGQYAAPLTTALAFAPAVFSLLKGDFKGAALSGGGAGIGFMLGGPAGAAIGGALGSLLGGAFGSRPKNPRIGALVSGTYSTATDKYRQTGITKGGAKKLDMTNATAIGQVNQAFLSQLGGFLDAMDVNANIQSGSGFYTKKGKKSIGQLTGSINGRGFGFSEVYGKRDEQAFQKYVDSVLGSVMVSAIKASPLSAALKSLFGTSTDKKVVLNMMNAVISLNREQDQLSDKYALTVDQAAQVSRATGLVGQKLVDFVNMLGTSVQTTGSVLMQARENLTESFGAAGVNSLPSSLKSFDDVLKGIDKTTKAGIKSFADLFSLREQFAAFTQSIDQLKGGVNQTLLPFLSAQEQQAIMQADLAKVFEQLNMSVPGSLQELIELGKGIDFTTKEGLDLAAVFPSLVQAFQQTQGQVTDLTDSLGQLDINKFRTFIDYQRAQNYLANGIPLSRLPSYDVGTSYVPSDGPAMIHQGERIVTAMDNQTLVSSVQNQGAGLQAMAREIGTLRAVVESMRGFIAVTADSTKMTANILKNVSPNGDAIQTEALV